MGAAVERLILLSQVKAHTMRTKSGKVVQVRDYVNSLPSGVSLVVDPPPTPGFTPVYRIRAMREGREVGNIEWYGGGEIRRVSVDPAFRHKGVAAALFFRAREVEPSLHHSDILTPEGTAWARKMDDEVERRVMVGLSHVRAHMRKTASGKVVKVKAYDTKAVKSLVFDATDTSEEAPTHGWPLKFPQIASPKSGYRPVSHEAGDVEAVARYAGDGYSYNQYLRGSKVKEPLGGGDWYRERVLALDNAMAVRTVTKPFTTYRVVGKYVTTGAEQWLPDHLEPGATLSDKGYSSTTPFKAEIARILAGQTKQVVLQIDVPKGVHALYVPEVLGKDTFGEGEVLLERGLTFEVVRDTTAPTAHMYHGEKQHASTRVVHVKVVPKKPDLALAAALVLSHVKAHTKMVNGKTVWVKAYDTKTERHALEKVLLKRNDVPPTEHTFANIDMSTDPDDAEHLRNYIDYGDDYNRNLRRGSPDPDESDDIENFDKVVAKGKVVEPFTTYRSMVDADWLPPGHLQPGTVLSDAGYTSTTPFGATAATWVPENGVSFAIKVPKGATAIYVPEVMSNDTYGEAEVLLPRNSKFEVISDDPEGIAAERLHFPWTHKEPPTYHRLITVRLVT